jgi:protein-disulfide isomerase
MKRVLPVAIIVLVLAVSVLGAWYMKRSRSSPSPNTSQKQPRAQGMTAAKPGASPAHRNGSADAKVAIEEFADFECGGCGVVHPIIMQMEKEFGARITIVFREYPLEIHKNGMTAAQAAESAGLQGKFWEMHHLLFENQKTWHGVADVRPIYREYANQIGLDVDKFERDMASDSVKRRIAADQDRAASLRVNSTPTAFLNGREIPFDTLISAEKLKALINAELSSPQTTNNQ